MVAAHGSSRLGARRVPDVVPTDAGSSHDHLAADRRGGAIANAPGEPDQTAARAYGRARRRIGYASAGVQLVLVVLGALAGRRIADALDVPGPLVVDALVFTLVAGGGLELVLLPFSLARHRLSRAVGISRQDVRGWLADRLKGGALALAFGTLAITAIVWLARVEPTWWWLIAVVAAVAFELLLTAVAPVLLVPIFLRSRPLADGALRDDLLGAGRSRRRPGRLGARAAGGCEDGIGERGGDGAWARRGASW